MTDQAFSVLLVDDDPHTGNIFRMVMDYHNCELQVADTAEAALKYLETYQPDVIVMDIFLPDADGFQAFNTIRRNALAPNSRIIATTAYHTTETHQDVLSRGFNGFLPKPFESTALIPYIRNIVTGS